MLFKYSFSDRVLIKYKFANIIELTSVLIIELGLIDKYNLNNWNSAQVSKAVFTVAFTNLATLP